MYHVSTFARATPDKLALLFVPSGLALTFRELDLEANRAANALRALGLKRGDCIAFCVENSPTLVTLTLAAQRIGLYYTLLSTRLSLADFDYILANSKAGAAIVSATTEVASHLVGYDRPDVRLIGIGFNDDAMEDWAAHLVGASIALPAQPSPGREMLYSSGSTGRPKGVRKAAFEGEFDAPDSRNTGTARVYAMDSSTVYLSTSPLYHSAPNRFLSTAMHLGATSIVMEKFDASLALESMERHFCSHSLWVPTMFHRMLRLPADIRRNFDVSSMAHAIHGAAPCPAHIKHAMIDWWGPVLEEYYSGTEGIGATSINSAEWLAHPGSVGRASDGILHILDDEGEELPVGQIGNVFFESDAKFEYWNDPGKTQSITSRHGWRSFGDVGRLDEEGFLYLADRKDFMIISGGVNIYPIEVENVLLADPRVLDAAVFGIPNDEFGEEVKAVVQLADAASAGPVVEQALRELCRCELGPIKTPRSIDFEVNFPRHATGKLYKKTLRDRYLKPATGGASTS